MTTTPDPRVYAILQEAGYGADLFNPRQHACCELVDEYVRGLAITLLERLDLVAPLARASTVEELYQAARARRSGRWGPAERIEAHRNAELAVTRSRRLARLIDATRHRVQTSQTPRP